MSLTDDPAVLIWMLALAPRGRAAPTGRHWWRELVTDAWRCADHAWWLQREAIALGYETEMAEYAAEHPRPRLADFMVHLSHGTWSPDTAARQSLSPVVIRG